MAVLGVVAIIAFLMYFLMSFSETAIKISETYYNDNFKQSIQTDDATNKATKKNNVMPPGYRRYDSSKIDRLGRDACRCYGCKNCRKYYDGDWTYHCTRYNVYVDSFHVCDSYSTYIPSDISGLPSAYTDYYNK